MGSERISCPDFRLFCGYYKDKATWIFSPTPWSDIPFADDYWAWLGIVNTSNETLNDCRVVPVDLSDRPLPNGESETIFVPPHTIDFVTSKIWVLAKQQFRYKIYINGELVATVPEPPAYFEVAVPPWRWIGIVGVFILGAGLGYLARRR